MRNHNHGRLGIALAGFCALTAPMEAANACSVPIEKNPKSAYVDIILLATALDEVEYGSFRASSARVDKVIEGKYTSETYQLYGEKFRSTCNVGDDVGKGTKLVIYLHDYIDPKGGHNLELLYWLPLTNAERLDPRFQTKP
jgi:hypothetical protein